MDSDGVVVDNARMPNVSDEEVLKWYTNMLTAGEEGIAVGSASALSPEDVIFAQYRETGVFQQRGFTLKDFMSQLFANRHDNAKGRNMPVHYGSSRLNIVCLTHLKIQGIRDVYSHDLKAHNLLHPRNSNPPSLRRRLRPQTPIAPKPQPPPTNRSLLLRRRCRQRRRLPRRPQYRRHPLLPRHLHLP
ncbi:MAG: hypothetical protein Q9198_007233 [Flavoplaca austrocitrina]